MVKNLDISHFQSFHCSSNDNEIENVKSQARTFSSGCNDAFSVFGGLAFLLALLDLILELNMNRKRRRRFAINDNLLQNENETIQNWNRFFEYSGKNRSSATVTEVQNEEFSSKVNQNNRNQFLPSYFYVDNKTFLHCSNYIWSADDW